MKLQGSSFRSDEPAIAARIIRPKLSRQLHKFCVRELVRRYLVRAHNLAQHIDLAEADLTNHVDELTKLDLAIAACVDFLDETDDLFGRQILSKLLQSSGDLSRINAEKHNSDDQRMQ